MTNLVKDGMITGNKPTTMAIRPKIQIDTPNTNNAIAELAKRLSTLKGITQREYMLAMLYKGAENDGLKSILYQELGADAKSILEAYDADMNQFMRSLLN